MSAAADPQPARDGLATAPISDEEYDGIRELDNPQPTWFRLIFLATVLFAAGYWIWYHLGGPGEPHLAIYEKQYAEHRARRASSRRSRSPAAPAATAPTAAAWSGPTSPTTSSSTGRRAATSTPPCATACRRRA